MGTFHFGKDPSHRDTDVSSHDKGGHSEQLCTDVRSQIIFPDPLPVKVGGLGFLFFSFCHQSLGQ